MKKFVFLLGLGLGFVLGSRAGRSSYDDLVDKGKQFAENPDVQDAARRAGDQARKGADYVREHAPSAAGSAASAASSAAASATDRVRGRAGADEGEDAQTTAETATFTTVEDVADTPGTAPDGYRYPEGTVNNPVL